MVSLSLRRALILGALSLCLAACGRPATNAELAGERQLALAATAAAAPTAAEQPAAPTAAPTSAPTVAPTVVPTAAATVVPTAAPTAVAPTSAPTAAPSAAPTVAPTVAPSAAPTVAPTVAPTAAPTDVPTAAPSAAPTVAPTAAPTVAPTAAPTDAPLASDGTPAELDFSELYDGASIAGPVLSRKAQQLSGRPVIMTGYMAPPLKPDLDFFVLTQSPMVYCPFCSSAADWPYNIVFVRMAGGRTVPPMVPSQAIRVVGTFSTGQATDQATGFVSLVRIVADDVQKLP